MKEMYGRLCPQPSKVHPDFRKSFPPAVVASSVFIHTMVWLDAKDCYRLIGAGMTVEIKQRPFKLLRFSQ